MLKYFSLLLFINFQCLLVAQEKIEIEKPIDYKEVPETAKKYVCELFPEARIRWIYEISNSGNSVEAKVKNNKERYSIEFGTKGEFQDVEKRIEKEEINEAALEKISRQFATDFDRYKIKKIQHHYSGEGDEVMKLLKGEGTNSQFIQQLYEIVVYGEKDREQAPYEYTFQLNGDFVERIKNSEMNTDNLLF